MHGLNLDIDFEDVCKAFCWRWGFSGLFIVVFIVAGFLGGSFFRLIYRSFSFWTCQIWVERTVYVGQSDRRSICFPSNDHRHR